MVDGYPFDYLPYLPVMDADATTLPSIAFLKDERETLPLRSSFSTLRA
jgi:hypothetical protein